MTRTVIGFLILISLLVSGLLVQQEMTHIHRPVSQTLDLSAERAAENDWETARKLSRQAQSTWETHWKFSAAFADHNPMEEIDSLFARAQVSCQQEDVLEYAATCRELARRLDAMAEAHTLTWWNLL